MLSKTSQDAFDAISQRSERARRDLTFEIRLQTFNVVIGAFGVVVLLIQFPRYGYPLLALAALSSAIILAGGLRHRKRAVAKMEEFQAGSEEYAADMQSLKKVLARLDQETSRINSR